MNETKIEFQSMKRESVGYDRCTDTAVACDSCSFKVTLQLRLHSTHNKRACCWECVSRMLVDCHTLNVYMWLNAYSVKVFHDIQASSFIRWCVVPFPSRRMGTVMHIAHKFMSINDSHDTTTWTYIETKWTTIHNNKNNSNKKTSSSSSSSTAEEQKKNERHIRTKRE